MPSTVTMLMLLLALVLQSISGVPLDSSSNRVKRASFDRDCVRFCHSECNKWQGYDMRDLKSCAMKCSELGGLPHFQTNFDLRFCLEKRQYQAAMSYRKRYLDQYGSEE